MLWSAQYFSVWYLKDAFFCIPLHPYSQYLFVFVWRDPDTLEATQYPWTVLPQGFQDSPHLFGNAKDLSLHKGTLQQYIDGLLISSDVTGKTKI